MTEARHPPDVPRVLVEYLKSSTDMVITNDRISTRLPKTFPDGARVRIHRSGGRPVDRGTEAIDAALIQADCYGDTEEEATDVANQLIVALLRAQYIHSFVRASISAIERVSGPFWNPDEPTSTPCFTLQVRVTARSQ